MPYASAKDGTRLYYKDWGKGDPVVLIHGWPLSADTWDAVALRLAEAGHRCIMPDRRGFGRSEQPWDGHDYDTYAEDVAAVIDAAGAGDKVALVGFSMGGGEVARFASRNGGRVSRAVLISSVVPFLLKTKDNPDGVPQDVFDQMAEGMKEDRAEFFRGFFKDFFGVGVIRHPVSEGVLMNAWRQAMLAGLRPTLAAARAFATTDFRPDLPALASIPTLVIHGTSDQTVPIELTAHQVAKSVPNARLIEYEGAAHGVFETDKERLGDDLIAFLGKGRTGAGGGPGAGPAQG